MVDHWGVAKWTPGDRPSPCAAGPGPLCEPAPGAPGPAVLPALAVQPAAAAVPDPTAALSLGFPSHFSAAPFPL